MLMWLCIFFFFSSGCVVQSLNPFYTQEMLVDLPALEGQWSLIREPGHDVSEKDIKLWVIKGEEMSIFDTDGNPASVIIKFFKVGEITFGDIYPVYPGNPESPEKMNHYWGFLIHVVHTVCKVDIQDDLLTLVLLNYDHLQKEIEGGRVHLSYHKDESDLLMFTASPLEWQEFLQKYKDDPEFFTKDDAAFVLKRIK